MQFLQRGVFFRNQRKPRKFSIGHRIYDERKDKLNQRIAMHESKGPGEESREAYHERVRVELRKGRPSKSSSSSTLRILVIFVALMIVAYLFLSK